MKFKNLFVLVGCRNFKCFRDGVVETERMAMSVKVDFVGVFEDALSVHVQI